MSQEIKLRLLIQFRIRIQWICRVVANTLDNPQSLSLSLSEKDSITRREEFRALDKPESNQSTISRPDEGTVNINH